MALTASFNAHTLGDYVEEVKSSDNRGVIVQQPAGEDGIITRDRGGGQLDVTVRFNIACADQATALAYRSTLRASMGNAKHDLMIDNATYESDLLCTGLSEVKRVGTFVRLEAKFIGSAL